MLCTYQKKKIKRECKWWTRIPIRKHICCICNVPLAWLCLPVAVSLTGRYSLRWSADRVAVAHRRRHARRGSDAAAGFPRQVSPATGSRHHSRLVLWKSAQRTKERRSHCERRGERHSQHEYALKHFCANYPATGADWCIINRSTKVVFHVTERLLWNNNNNITNNNFLWDYSNQKFLFPYIMKIKITPHSVK